MWKSMLIQHITDITQFQQPSVGKIRLKNLIISSASGLIHNFNTPYYYNTYQNNLFTYYTRVPFGTKTVESKTTEWRKI